MTKHCKTLIVGLCLPILFLCTYALAGVTPQEADQLKSDLTPFGAERAGNADGTIPSWEGGLTGVPQGLSYAPGDYYADPFEQDEVLFSITAQDMDQYADQLSAGQQAMFKKYPDTYRIDVYKTRRTAAAPQWVYDNFFKNATRTTLSEDKLGVLNTYGGVPFPIPKRGEEVIFNHIQYYRGAGREGKYMSGVILPDGDFSIGGGGYVVENAAYAFKDGSIDNFVGETLQLLIDYNAPERRKGELALIRDPVDLSKHKRKAWQYLPGQRRVRRAPTIAYDTPEPDTGGLMTYDGGFMFNGAIDRYDWKIIGKKELYIPYNCYQFHNGERQEVLSPGHQNPDMMRWELHRVWVVEATLKEGKRHIYGKRVFYMDEDTWICVLTDNYDRRGNLWRSALGTTWNHYNIPAVILLTTFIYDFQKEIYAVDNLLNSMGDYWVYDAEKGHAQKRFTPENLRKLGKR